MQPRDDVPLDALLRRTADVFEKQFHRRPSTMAVAPGRVNLIGEHTDYNGGYVLPMAIERYTAIAADLADAIDADQTRAYFYSAATDETALITWPEPKGIQPHWASYPQGVLAGCTERGWQIPSFEAVIDSTLPMGGGLSSSAALEVATATLAEALTGQSLNGVELALLCQQAEHDYAHVPCGIMDQFICSLAKADCLMLLDCRSQQSTMVPLRDPSVAILIVNSGVQHRLSDHDASPYANRRAACEAAAAALGVAQLRDVTMGQLEEAQSRLTPEQFRRARHVVSEIARTQATAVAVRKEDWPAVGRFMAASHTSLRDDFAVSCREIDLLVDLAMRLGSSGGVWGSRITGGGFGGCTVNLVRTEAVPAIRARLAEDYERITGIAPQFIATRPTQGAHLAPVDE